jgi:hypothetical protein
MTQLKDLIQKHIDSIKFNGCTLTKEMLTLMFEGVLALAKIQESMTLNQRCLDSLPTAFGNGGNDQPDPHKGFIVGEVYKHSSDELAYYCGINYYDKPVFELIECDGVKGVNLPENWASKGNNTYWSHEGIFDTFNPTYIVMPDTIGQHITEPESVNQKNIKPKQMVMGNWYMVKDDSTEWLLQFDKIEENNLFVEKAVAIKSGNLYGKSRHCSWYVINRSQIRPATIEEVTKYFPNEFESNVTDPQL